MFCALLHRGWLPVVCGVLVCAAGAITTPAEADDAATNLPLKKVILFSSGVGYFQHDGQVAGNTHAELKFKAEDINDLLKSMVVQDLDGGQVSTVNYGSKEPVAKTLHSFAIDLTANPTLADLLKQVRGEQVEIEAPNKITGLILGVERRRKEVDKDKIIEVDVLDLLTDDGLRAVQLDAAGRIKLTNPKLDAELRQALALLATSHATDKKAVALNFVGEGKRRVLLGYIQETPVWKTSYRLVLGDKKPAFLQGWAIVENTTDQDWSGVRLALVSGRPISFTMDLYQPLYVARPAVEMELYASLRPQVYGQDMANRDEVFRKRGEAGEGKDDAKGERRARASFTPYLRLAAPAPPGAMGMEQSVEQDRAKQLDGLDMRQTARSMAQAGQLGEMFQYDIATPVSLPRQQSAMLPIVNEEVQGEKVSIYNPNVLAKHPLCGLRLVNSTKLHLMQGPITVFDDSAYAGDAQIQDLSPGSQRLISYAVDLDTEVAVENKGAPEQILAVKCVRGTLQTTRKYARRVEYTVKNSGHKEKKVLVEYPLDAAWTLVEPKKAEEKTRECYRFAVAAKPGEPAKLMVHEERTASQYFAMINVDDGTIALYLRASETSPAVKAALGEVIKRKSELARVAGQRQERERQIQEIDADQARIRQNMTALDHASDVYKRYVKKFSDQEDQIEKLRGEIRELSVQETSLRKALDDYLAGLNVG